MATPTVNAPAPVIGLPPGFEFETTLTQARAMLCLIQMCASGDYLPVSATRDDESIYQSLRAVEDMLKDAEQGAAALKGPSSSITQMIRMALGLARVVLSSFDVAEEPHTGQTKQICNDELSSHAIWALEGFVVKVVAACSGGSAPKETPASQRH